MKISIVTISFNQGQFLERCIRSVIEQNYGNIEYIVVDAGSKDGSRGVIERYRDKISKIILEPDDGPADGLNKGFAVATGDIFGFLNSDDILLPKSVLQVANYFKNNSHIDIVSGDALIIDEQNHVIRKSYSDRFSLLRYAYDACVLLQPSTFFRRSAFEKVDGFNIKNERAWDGELWVDMALKGMKFAAVRRFWSGFRLHDSSITASASADDPIGQYYEYIFLKIMNRNKTMVDYIISKGLRLARHLLNPRDTVQRILYGPIYGRSKYMQMMLSMKKVLII
jgi:glycosyltransferase involved in cell wall biosynthesis